MQGIAERVMLLACLKKGAPACHVLCRPLSDTVPDARFHLFLPSGKKEKTRRTLCRRIRVGAVPSGAIPQASRNAGNSFVRQSMEGRSKSGSPDRPGRPEKLLSSQSVIIYQRKKLALTGRALPSRFSDPGNRTPGPARRFPASRGRDCPPPRRSRGCPSSRRSLPR